VILDDRKNNLLKKTKGKICPPFCPMNTDKSSSMIAEDIHHQGTVFKNLNSLFQ